MDLAKTGKCISNTRRKSALTQEELAEKIGVTAQAVSKWENGCNLPDVENLMRMAEVLNVPYSLFFEPDEWNEDGKAFGIKGRLFHEDNMYTRIKSFALSERLDETFRALRYMRDCHAGQFRKQRKYSTERVPYINHPLLMACQAHALGIRDDALLAAILLHDVVEDTGVQVEELPFSEEIKRLVGLVSFSVPDGMTKQEAKDEYYRRIAGNGKACVIKIIDRCNNVSTMAGSFSREKLLEYIKETEQYVLPLIDVLKNDDPQYSDLAFLVKYQIISILETVKYLLLPTIGGEPA